MTISSFPNGFKGGLVLSKIPALATNPGQIFWVSNNSLVGLNEKNGSDGNDGSFLGPFATLKYAVSRCKAGRGDKIYIKPGHVEALSGALAIDINLAGIDIEGLGAGIERPTFTLGTTATTMSISANDVKLKNIVLQPAVDHKLL